jgi:ferredoxin
MARVSERLPANVPGDFFVDSTCIDCDLCRQIAPTVFCANGEQSIVYHQPETPGERLRAGMALVTCPTASIVKKEQPRQGRNPMAQSGADRRNLGNHKAPPVKPHRGGITNGGSMDPFALSGLGGEGAGVPGATPSALPLAIMMTPRWG